MANTLSAGLHIEARATITYDPALDSSGTGAIAADLENVVNGRRWTNGIGSGQVDRVLSRTRTIGAAATHTYNLLAAGSLTDPDGNAIDGDELKGLVVICDTGGIRLDAPAALFLGIFKAASDGLVLAAGQSVAFDLGAAGLDVTVNSIFTIVDTAGGAGSTYRVWAIVAQ